jgi:hypothetical protein
MRSGSCRVRQYGVEHRRCMAFLHEITDER